MIFSQKSAVLAALAGTAVAQLSLSPSTLTDAATGINFSTWATPGADGAGAFSFGFVLPEDALQKDATEYIGRLQCQTTNATATGWCGIAHGGHMPSDLLLMAWPYQNHVFTSFRCVDDYFLPGQFGGDNGTNGTSAAFPAPELTVLHTAVNATSFEVVYRCQNCWAWQQGTYNETVHTALQPGNAESVLVLGYAQATKGPTNPACTGNGLNFGFHDNGYAQWGAPVSNATRPAATYAAWTKLATQAPNAGANSTASSCQAKTRRWAV
ncbi:hypothetical protein SPBR_03169 [Sporothrix brasiliensis 5110]|uniref:Cellobiose dehydrogenase-like cytochrome domain-containing protein n=1 Tax=Sporothrix brasiliensis 5110 TaxID=1398154 RepID=A0A0C2EZV3_9PEZI|nr:uncharacterized protein SPBR_03169 [Sporothrix brasiliensis 5110]KIH92074.1 hypothetical protein SPBR_03169 [Sporothrix brasiliensis 5110]